MSATELRYILNGKLMSFRVSVSNDIERSRVDTIWTKEPETIAWIDSFEEDAVFVDVGANIGLYSLYALLGRPTARVFAAEPHPETFKALDMNFKFNADMMKQAFAAPWCVGADNGRCALDEVSSERGSSGHQMNRERIATIPMVNVDGIGELIKVWGWPPITHVKIDIDGLEWDVVRGMANTLKAPHLKSVLIEINDNQLEIATMMTDAGFTSYNVYNLMSPHSTERRKLEGIAARNVVYMR